MKLATVKSMKICAAQINPTIGDLSGNEKKIIDAISRARSAGAKIVLFPELALCGYFPGDLLLDRLFIDAMEEKLKDLASHTSGIMVVVGLARISGAGSEKGLYNSAAVLIDGKIVGFQNKRLLPTYDVFDERRYFEPGKAGFVWEFEGRKIGITICEDLWSGFVKETTYQIDPIEEIKGVDLILNLSGSPYSYKRKERRVEVCQKKKMGRPFIYCNQVGANDELIFDGHSFVMNREGHVVKMARGFVEEDLLFDLEKEEASTPWEKNEIGDLYQALVLGVRDYFTKQGFKKALVGVSGGIDSALVLCIAKDALGEKGVEAITMPTRYNPDQGLMDARKLARNLGVTFQSIPIDSFFQNTIDFLVPHLKEIPSDLTEQNIQPRIRALILMAFSNQKEMILLNTANKSELALGYSTLYGDLAGGLGVLQDVLKLQVYELARYVNEKKEIIPIEILDKVPSAELKENQTDFDTLPLYEVLDPILVDYLEEGQSVEEISKKRGLPLKFVQGIITKVHKMEYKRRQTSIGLRVSLKAFGKGREVPIVQKWK